MKECILSIISCSLLFFCALLAFPTAEAAELDEVWLYHAGDLSLSELGEDSWKINGVQENESWKRFAFPDMPEVSRKNHDLWLTTTLHPGTPGMDTLLFRTTQQAVRVWLDDRPIYAYGEIGSSLPDGQHWNLIRLPDITDDAQLTIQIYSKNPGDLRELHYFSLDNEVVQAQRLFFYDFPFAVSLPAAVVTVVILLAFNHKAWRRVYRRLIVLISVLMLWMLSSMNLVQACLPLPAFWWYLQMFMGYLIPLAAYWVIQLILEPDLAKDMKYVLGAFVLLFASAILGEMLGFPGFEWGLPICIILTIVAQLWVTVWLVASVRRGNIYSKALMVPVTVLMALLLFDGIRILFPVKGFPFNLAPLSIYAFVIFLFILIREQLFLSHKLESETVGLEFEAAQAVERAEVDPLTNCLNRTAFNRFMAEQMEHPEKRFCLVMLDIDHFKSVNDTYGHSVGDKVLKKVTRIVRRQLDRRTKFFRWGGEEFVVLCPDMEIAEAAELALLLCHSIAETSILPERPVTISLGVAIWHGREDKLNSLFRRMDQALYRAKEGGRNRVALEIAEDGGE